MDNLSSDEATFPSEIDDHVGVFDRFASVASVFCSRAPFFAACVLLVVIWLPSYFIVRDVNTWQLVINTITTVVTFLLVALLQNSETRSDQALQHKLNAIAHALAALSTDRADAHELKSAVGLEDRETSA